MALNKKAAAVIGTGAAVTAASYALTDWMLRMAIDRNSANSLPVNRDENGGDPYAMFREYGQALRDTPHETVEMLSRDGIKLTGHLFEVPSPKRIILAAHGWRSSWYSNYGYSYGFFRDEGCTVLYIEQRGQGNSGGRYIGFGLLERYDIADWLAWIEERFGDSLPVYAVGISMGATAVLMASGLELPGNVRGIVADCGFTSPDAIWKHVVRHDLHLPFLMTGLFSRMISRRLIGMSSSSYSTVDALRVNRLPVLFVHGQDDSFVPVGMTKENYEACTAEKDILIVPGAAHGMSYAVDRERYEEKERQFWQKYDK